MSGSGWGLDILRVLGVSAVVVSRELIFPTLPSVAAGLNIPKIMCLGSCQQQLYKLSAQKSEQVLLAQALVRLQPALPCSGCLFPVNQLPCMFMVVS